MAENPATWGPVEHAVNDALNAAHAAREAKVIGASTPRRIADELRKRGLVIETDERELDATACPTCSDAHRGGTH